MQQLTVIAAIDLALEQDVPFYVYRLPGGRDLCFGAQLTGEVAVFDRMVWQEGFVAVPFEESDAVPSLFVQAEVAFCNATADADLIRRLKACKKEGGDRRVPEGSVARETYRRQVTEMIDALRRGEVRKMVLSRGVTRQTGGEVPAAGWFGRLAEAYPDAFVFLVSVPGRMAWMGASPEIFLEQEGRSARTMALAGTRPAGTPGEWGQKEREEQRIVAEDIAGVLGNEDGWRTSGTFVRQAGKIEHLCTVFTSAGPLDEAGIESLRHALHPTPAVGGSPACKALPMLRKIEGSDRRYYAGYVGPVGKDRSFHWFVNLRSMELFRQAVRLYVGGGITAESDPEKEWEETEWKARTLLDVMA